MRANREAVTKWFSKWFLKRIGNDLTGYWKSNFRCHSERSEKYRNGFQTGFFTSLRSVQSIKFRVFQQSIMEKNYAVHDWNKFILPEELLQLFYKYNLRNIEFKGVQFSGITKNGFKTKIGDNTKISYIGYAKRE